MRSRLFKLILTLFVAGLLWCLTWLAAVIFAPFAVAAAIASVGYLAWTAVRRWREDPRDTVGATVVGLVAVAFGISMCLPLWRHSGFDFDENGKTYLVPHSHGILDADHVH